MTQCVATGRALAIRMRVQLVMLTGTIAHQVPLDVTLRHIQDTNVVYLGRTDVRRMYSAAAITTNVDSGAHVLGGNTTDTVLGCRGTTWTEYSADTNLCVTGEDPPRSVTWHMLSACAAMRLLLCGTGPLTVAQRIVRHLYTVDDDTVAIVDHVSGAARFPVSLVGVATSGGGDANCIGDYQRVVHECDRAFAPDDVALAYSNGTDAHDDGVACTLPVTVQCPAWRAPTLPYPGMAYALDTVALLFTGTACIIALVDFITRRRRRTEPPAPKHLKTTRPFVVVPAAKPRRSLRPSPPPAPPPAPQPARQTYRPTIRPRPAAYDIRLEPQLLKPPTYHVGRTKLVVHAHPLN